MLRVSSHELCIKWNTIYAICIFALTLHVARIAVDIPAKPWTKQWIGEMLYWSFFPLVTSVPHFGFEPIKLPQHWLSSNPHSELKLRNFFVKNDSDAISDFWAAVKSSESYDQILVLRRIWDDDDDKLFLKEFQDTETFLKHSNLQAEYDVLKFSTGEPGVEEKMNLSEYFAQLNDTDSISYMGFLFNFFETQNVIKDAYFDVLNKMATPPEYHLETAWSLSHVFLYSGSIFGAFMHAASSADLFLQVSNSKRWRFTHKKYLPYLGSTRFNRGGALLFAPVFELPNDSIIPFTDIIINPGDALYFTGFQSHSVTNLQEGLGFAIGFRPFRTIFTETFYPLWTYNIINGVVKVTFDALFGKLTSSYGAKERECADGQSGLKYAPGYSGSDMDFYQYSKVNGVCQFQRATRL